MTIDHRTVAILPVNDIEAAQHFFERLRFRLAADHGEYRILADGRGWHLNGGGLAEARRNPFGLYLYSEEVDRLAAEFRNEIIGPSKVPSHKEWGMYEFAAVRVGWPMG